MVSMKDIAKSCGVSVATVSKALNDQKDVSEEMKHLVRETAKNMGYLPNVTAQALRTKKSHTIGVLFGDENGSGLTDEFFSHVFNSFKKAAEAKGYEIIFLSRKIGGHQMTYMDHCKYRSVDGILLGYIHYTEEEVKELLNSNLPTVTMDYVFNEKPSVCFDHAKGMMDLTSYICEMGHTKIAYIHGEKSHITQSRLTGFYRALEYYGITVPDSYVREAGYLNYKKTAEVTEELLCLPDPPTCIIYPNDFSSLGGIGVIHKHGLSIPEDISIAGYDGIPLSKAMIPELTTLVQDSTGMGQAIASCLMEQIESKETALIERIMVVGTVSFGQSVKRLK